MVDNHDLHTIRKHRPDVPDAHYLCLHVRGCFWRAEFGKDFQQSSKCFDFIRARAFRYLLYTICKFDMDLFADDDMAVYHHLFLGVYL
jgi:hypothetical protein